MQQQHKNNSNGFLTQFKLPFLAKSSELIYEIENGILQSGNRIISPTSRALIYIHFISFPGISRNDLIHLNLDPFAPIGSNGQYLPLEPITICTSRCNCFVV